jgi:glycerate kinase
VLCAPNAFKGTLTAAEAAEAMSDGVRDAGLEPIAMPVADGGDGTLDVLLRSAGDRARITTHTVTGPLGGPVQAQLGWLDDTLAVVEMAEAAGLRLLDTQRLDPLHATSRGAGELIVAALDQRARRVIVGVGGSASTDGGAGALQALGVHLLDARGGEITTGGEGLAQLHRIDMTDLHPALSVARIEVAVDVRNPLSGPDGAAFVFAPQKGASETEVALLDAALTGFARIAEQQASAAGLADRPGTGAAGGAAFGLALIGATLSPGAALVCDLIGFNAALSDAHLVLTGEGRLDAQTAFGKAPSEVAARARHAQVPCCAIAGRVIDPLAGVFARVVSLDEIADATASDEGVTVLQPMSLLRRASAKLTHEFARGSQ